jgi:anti-sigma B factor antagonist
MFNVSLVVSDYGRHAVVTLRGELDIADAADVAAAITAAATGRIETVVDLADLTFIDCSGVAALARARAQIRHAGGVLLLASPRRHVRRVISMSGLIDITGIYVSTEHTADLARRAGRLPWPAGLGATKSA